MRTTPSLFSPTRWFLIAAVLLLVGAAWLRWSQIERRPFHADEGVQAYQTWQLLRGDGLPGAYGLGNVRTLDEFMAFSGIDYKTNGVTEPYEGRLC